MIRKPTKLKSVESLKHEDAKRPNIPTAEYEPVVDDSLKTPILVAYERRNPDLDPQLVWRGKDLRDWSELVVPAPPLYIQEKVHPKVLVDDLLRQSKERADTHKPVQLDLFADFNGIPDGATGTEFYQHDANWTNRLILGDSLQVMASLAEREGLRGKVQCIYIDPPYGIKFNSNFQWSTTERDVKDGKSDHITREPEQVKAFRDTWRDGIHSYLTYLRDRLTVAHALLAQSGSIFVQIGDENVHFVRALLDEVFGPDNFFAQINFKSTSPLGQKGIAKVYDYLIWYARDIASVKFRPVFLNKDISEDKEYRYLDAYDSDLGYRKIDEGEFKALPNYASIFRRGKMTSSGFTPSCIFPFELHGMTCKPFGRKSWRTNQSGIEKLIKANRLFLLGNSPYFKQYYGDFSVNQIENSWIDQPPAIARTYVVETAIKFIQRCILMTTDPGDLVLDPTCGSGTTAYVAEQWGRRWITIDTSRVALALARARIMGARYPYYLLADSRAGQQKEAELRGAAPASAPAFNDLRHGFVYERVPHVTLKSIANNAAIDVIWEQYQPEMEALRAEINRLGGTSWAEWEMPRAGEGNRDRIRDRNRNRKDEESITNTTTITNTITTTNELEELLAKWWELRIARQRAIDASIAAAADQEFLYDKPYQDKSIVRVAGPFTVESLSPHRVLAVDADDELRPLGGGSVFHDERAGYAGDGPDFAAVILESLRAAGVQQAHRADRIRFTSLSPWPGRYIAGEGVYLEAETGKERRAGIFIGPEFGTVSRPDLVTAAREAADAGFDVLIACAFNYDAHSSEFERLGKVPILKARMNADLHMAGALADTGAGNLFVIFGEPDIAIRPAGDDQIEVEIRGVDVFHPQSGEVRSSGPEGIACWFIDTAYNEESFFVRHAYFLGMNDPYGALKTTLKAEIDEEAWESLYRAVSRPFPRPATGRIAVKVINHLGDEVMKVFSA